MINYTHLLLNFLIFIEFWTKKYNLRLSNVHYIVTKIDQIQNNQKT